MIGISCSSYAAGYFVYFGWSLFACCAVSAARLPGSNIPGISNVTLRLKRILSIFGIKKKFFEKDCFYFALASTKKKQHSFFCHFIFLPFLFQKNNLSHKRITTITVEKQTKEILPAPLWRGCPSHVTSHYIKHTHTWRLDSVAVQRRSDRIWNCHRGDFYFGDCFSTQGGVRSRAIWKSNFSRICTWQPFTFRHVIVLNKFETLLIIGHFSSLLKL